MAEKDSEWVTVMTIPSLYFAKTSKNCVNCTFLQKKGIFMTKQGFLSISHALFAKVIF